MVRHTQILLDKVRCQISKRQSTFKKRGAYRRRRGLFTLHTWVLTYNYVLLGIIFMVHGPWIYFVTTHIPLTYKHRLLLRC